MTTSDSATAAAGEQRMKIDGKLVEAKSGKVFDNINPATEEVLGQVADAGHEDMDDAIAAARRAFDQSGWATSPHSLTNSRTRRYPTSRPRWSPR